MTRVSLFAVRPDPGRPLEGRRHARATDTEISAAERVLPRSGSQRRRILERFVAMGGQGSTDYEAGQALGIFRWVAGTRREELIRDGWPIVDSGLRRPTDTGSPAIVWTLLEEGRREAMLLVGNGTPRA